MEKLRFWAVAEASRRKYMCSPCTRLAKHKISIAYRFADIVNSSRLSIAYAVWWPELFLASNSRISVKI